MPITIAPSTARGNETMPPISAAASPRSSVSGPMCTSSVDPWSVAVRSTAIAERNPAIVQTPVDTSFGLMPVSRARSALVAAARTASPNAVWPSSHHKPERDERHDDQDEQLRSRSPRCRSPGCQVPRERQRELRLERAGAVVGQRERHRLAELRDTDRRDEHDHARRLGTAGGSPRARRRCPMSVPTTSATSSAGQYGQPFASRP